MEKIVLGLSGGVDSALSAYLLKAQGYEVMGVYLENGSNAADDAKRVADDMGIDFMCVDIMAQLREKVIEPFIKGYLEAKTPIPCIACNPAVKFKVLFDVADEIGAKYVATGHYARITEGENGEKLLTKASSKNDQSYMLYRLPKDYIERLILPLGEYENKDAVRADADHSRTGRHRAGTYDSCRTGSTSGTGCRGRGMENPAGKRPKSSAGGLFRGAGNAEKRINGRQANL